MKIEITICHGQSPGFWIALGEILTQLEQTAQITQEKKIPMSTAEQVIVDRFNTATTAIANKIRDLQANPPADDAEFNNVLSGIADGLEALGSNGAPPVEPPPV